MNLLLVPALLPVGLMLAVLAMEKFEHWALRAVPPADGTDAGPSPAVPGTVIPPAAAASRRQERRARPRPRPRPLHPEHVRSPAAERAH